MTGLSTRKLQLALFLAAFFAIWTIRAVWLIEFDRSIESPETRLGFSILVKILLWVVPAALFAHWARKANPIHYLGVWTFPTMKTWAKCLLAIGAFCALILAFEMLAGDKTISLAAPGKSRLLPTIGFFLVSPFAEEMFFRGLVLQEISAFMRTAYANAVTSLLFVGIHLPYWIASGIPLRDMARDSAGVFLFSLFAGWLYSMGKSVWPPTLAHIANNMLTSCISPE